MTATKEEMGEIFAQAVEDMKRILGSAVVEGQGPALSPIVMMIMRKKPDLTGLPIQIQTLDKDEPLVDDGQPKVGIFSPITFTPPGEPRMPKEIFWKIMKVLGLTTNAYAMVVGMEAWFVRAGAGTTRDDFPKDLGDHPGRQEMAVISTEREGERGFVTAAIQRAEDGTITLGEWSAIDDFSKAEGNVFGSIPGNVHN